MDALMTAFSNGGILVRFDNKLLSIYRSHFELLVSTCKGTRFTCGGTRSTCKRLGKSQEIYEQARLVSFGYKTCSICDVEVRRFGRILKTVR